MQFYPADLASAPPVGSREFWGRPERVAASRNADEATAQTVEIMCGHINTGANDWAVQHLAQMALSQFGLLAFGLAGGDAAGRAAESVWWWCKNNIRFVHHELLLRRFLGERDHLQGLIAPDVLARLDRREGDCAIYSMMVCAMLRASGVDYELVTVAVNPREPNVFSHVYCYAIMPDGRRLPLDASHGDYAGWQVPARDVSRLQVWDSAGRPVEDRGSRFDGLHNYRFTGGLGSVCTPGDPDYDVEQCAGFPTSVDPNPFPGMPACTCVNGTCLESGNSCSSPGGGTLTAPPSNNSAQWAAFASALMRSGMTLAQINAIQPGTVVSANGAILRQSTGFAVPQTNVVSSLGGGSSLLYLGAGFLGLLVVGSMVGKK